MMACVFCNTIAPEVVCPVCQEQIRNRIMPGRQGFNQPTTSRAPSLLDMLLTIKQRLLILNARKKNLTLAKTSSAGNAEERALLQLAATEGALTELELLRELLEGKS